MTTPFRIPAMIPLLPKLEAYKSYLDRIDANRWYSNFGPLADELAHRLAHQFKVERTQVCLAANATLALAALLQEYSAKRPGGRCLMPSWTFAATAHAACLAGLQPKFADVDADTGQLTPERASQALDPTIAVVVVVSPFGSHVAPAAWENFAAVHGVGVVIDAAAAFDTVVASLLPSVVSLHATKPVSAGEGAFILCRDEALIERARRRTNFGFDAQRRSQDVGMNAKFSEYGAAIALAALDQWPSARTRLMAKGAHYVSRLAPLSVRPQQGWGHDWIGTTLNVRIGDGVNVTAADLSRDLAEGGIDARQWWGEGCHRQRAFLRFGEDRLLETQTWVAKTLGLPFYADIEDRDLDEVVARLAVLLERGDTRKDARP